MTAQMKSHTFYLISPVFINEWLCNFKIACHTNRIQKGAEMRLSDVFIKKLTSSAPHTWLVSLHKFRTGVTATGKTTTHKTYLQVFNYFLQTSTANKNIPGIEDDNYSFTQPRSKTLSQYANGSATQTLYCEKVYKEQNLSKFFIKGLDKSMI